MLTLKINIVNLGKMEYKDCLELQEKLVELRRCSKVYDTLLLVEHYPVLTIGKRGKRSNILLPENVLKTMGIGIYEVSRGGDVTYHGPGQLVGYPIMDLKAANLNIRDFVLNIEEVFIKLLKDNYNIHAHREEKQYTGVWVGNEKITAVGIAVKRGITMHGFAFNVNTCLEHFKLIVPCGIADRGVVSLEKLLGRPFDLERLAEQTADYFCRVFNLEPVHKKIGDLIE